MADGCGPECNGTWPDGRPFHVKGCPNDAGRGTSCSCSHQGADHRLIGSVYRCAVEGCTCIPDLSGRVSSLRFGFRRRCAWCGVVLRGWQLNLCRLCGPKAKHELGGPPCQSGSRWDAEPDAWRR